MGLDTLFEVNFADTHDLAALLKDLKKDELDCYENSVELCYWRRCWHVRRAIHDFLLDFGYRPADNDITEVSLDDALDCLTYIKKTVYKNNKTWGDTHDSPWTLAENKPIFKRYLRKAKHIARWLRQHPNVKYTVTYCDSY